MDFLIGVLVVLVILVVVVIGWWLSTHNKLVTDRNRIQESWRQVDVELTRRYELIPNLVETVRGIAAHERNTLESVIALRNSARQIADTQGAAPTAERAAIESQISQTLRNLVVSVEAYPELRSNANFVALQQELAETEDRIAAGRRYYNANVREYNTRIEQVPSNFVANAGKFEKATYFEANDPTVRSAPQVNFGEVSRRPEA